MKTEFSAHLEPVFLWPSISKFEIVVDTSNGSWGFRIKFKTYIWQILFSSSGAIQYYTMESIEGNGSPKWTINADKIYS